MFPPIHRRLIYGLVFILMLFSTLFCQSTPDPQRFIQEIEAFRQWDAKNALPEHPVLFIGSSSIRMWKTAEAFPNLPVVNRGFGGAQISDMLFYIDDILLKYPTPAVILFYCGDNDAADGKSAQNILRDYQTFVEAAWNAFPQTPVIYLPIKPSISRWSLWPVMVQANKLIRTFCEQNELLFYADTASPMLTTGQPPAAELFLEDGLHLSDKGYNLWKQVVEPLIKQALEK
jgi:lysophospholipase L1-like esterase